MAIEKLTLVDVEGSLKKINKTLVKCCESGCFHINPPPNISGADIGAKNLRDKGLYERMIKRYEIIAANIGITLDENASYDDVEYNVSIDFKSYIDEIDSAYSKLYDEKLKLNSELKDTGAIYMNLLQLSGFKGNFDELFSCEYIKIRFGRLPNGSVKKINFYNERNFFFFDFSEEEDYTWCLYLTTTEDVKEIDFLFKTLGFERTVLPRDLRGNVDEASEALVEKMKAMNARISEIDGEISAIAKSEQEKYTKVYAKLVAIDRSYDLRANVLVFDNRFHFSGYVPEKEAKGFTELLSSSGGVTVTVRDADEGTETPVKLKNNILFRPFEMFVKMYGLPAADGIDPTPLVAVTYMLMYGMMFGDVGQGLLIFILGLLLTRFTKISLAPIMTRIGLSSAVFGVLYGSVFGREDIIPPFFHIPQIYELLGYKEAPENIFQVSTVLLIAALCVGIILVVISMIVNIAIGIKSRNPETIFFGPSGVIGLVFYVGLIAGLACDMVFGIPLMQPWYIALVIVVPLLLMFFKEPIVHAFSMKRGTDANAKMDSAIKGRLSALYEKHGSKEKKSVGNFIIEGFIELFETCLTYLTNTMSYLRIGGFVLSHAGLMLVFDVVANMAGDGIGKIIILVIGNIFVTGFEGLLVGIQVLRLEFYELFSRFFKGGGKAFNPVTINKLN